MLRHPKHKYPYWAVGAYWEYPGIFHCLSTTEHRLQGELMSHEEVQRWYLKYEAYMTRLQEDWGKWESPRQGQSQASLPPRRLGFPEFERMWEAVMREPDLYRRWVRRLTVGYDQEKEEVRQIFRGAFSHRNAAASSPPQTPRRSEAA